MITFEMLEELNDIARVARLLDDDRPMAIYEVLIRRLLPKMTFAIAAEYRLRANEKGASLH